MKKQRGRPRKPDEERRERPRTVRLTNEWDKYLESYCDEYQLTPAQFMSDVIEEFLSSTVDTDCRQHDTVKSSS